MSVSSTPLASDEYSLSPSGPGSSANLRGTSASLSLGMNYVWRDGWIVGI